MPTITDLAKAISDALKPSVEPTSNEADVWGYRIDPPPRGIDDGDYGDPFAETRPDWLKATDDKGFTAWLTFRR